MRVNYGMWRPGRETPPPDAEAYRRQTYRGAPEPPEPPVLRLAGDPETAPRHLQLVQAEVHRGSRPRYGGDRHDRGQGRAVPPGPGHHGPGGHRPRPEPDLPDPRLLRGHRERGRAFDLAHQRGGGLPGPDPAGDEKHPAHADAR